VSSWSRRTRGSAGVGAEVGFVALLDWESAPKLILVRWRGRPTRDGIAVPVDGDAFRLLRRHWLLDRYGVTSCHRERLVRLASAGPVSPQAATVCAAAGPELRLSRSYTVPLLLTRRRG
jgi:hypothetical protein